MDSTPQRRTIMAISLRARVCAEVGSLLRLLLLAKASYPSHPVTPYNTYPAAPPSTPLTVGMDPEAVAQMSALKEKNSALESKVDELTALVKDLMDAEAKRYHGNGSKHASTGLLEGNHSKVLNRKKGEFQWERVPQEMYKMDGASFKGVFSHRAHR